MNQVINKCGEQEVAQNLQRNCSVNDILAISRRQKATCMYSEDELRTFSQEKLNTIFHGIQALAGRGPWKRKRSLHDLIGKGSGKRRKKKSC